MTAATRAVLIRGGGMAAKATAHLLGVEGVDTVGSAEYARVHRPVVMLSDMALGLLRDLFGRAELFTGQPRIERRIVAWGGGEAATFPHGAIGVGEAELIAALPARPLSRDQSDPWFTVTSAGGSRKSRCFGTRKAVAVAVDLAPGADRHACYVEATEAGWLFLIPRTAGKAWLLCVGGTPDAVLAASRLVRAQIGALGPVGARFETAPRISEALVGDDWLACGSSAIAFDPICGDGTAQALREAALATAVVAGIRDGGDAAALLGHYRAMLIAAMRRHLQISLPFYRSGGQSPWWRAQGDTLAEGYRWCTERLEKEPEPRFLLHGTRLIPRDRAA